MFNFDIALYVLLENAYSQLPTVMFVAEENRGQWEIGNNRRAMSEVAFWRCFSKQVFFFCLGFLSRTLKNHRAAEEGGGYFFSFSLPLPPASQTLRR